MVESRGVEPLSENLSARLSPSAADHFRFPRPIPYRQGMGFGSFIKSHLPQSLGRLVPHIDDAGYRSRGKRRADAQPN